MVNVVIMGVVVYTVVGFVVFAVVVGGAMVVIHSSHSVGRTHCLNLWE